MPRELINIARRAVSLR